MRSWPIYFFTVRLSQSPRNQWKFRSHCPDDFIRNLAVLQNTSLADAKYKPLLNSHYKYFERQWAIPDAAKSPKLFRIRSRLLPVWTELHILTKPLADLMSSTVEMLTRGHQEYIQQKLDRVKLPRFSLVALVVLQATNSFPLRSPFKLLHLLSFSLSSFS